jgi:4-hydroxybenzoate polyprenyltransferase
MIVALLGPLTLVLSFLFDIRFGVAALAYVLLQAAYTLALKHVVILDVFVISFGFLVRVIAGALPIHVVISKWILICTMLLALFLALSKRRHEIVLLERRADTHRLILREYTPYLLDQMIGVVTSATLVAYMIFTLAPETVAKFGGNMVLTVPFVLYGIFRYLYLVHTKNTGGMPEETLLTDLPLQVNILAYGVVSILVIYF